MAAASSILVLNRVSLHPSMGEQAILQDVSFDVEPGSRIAILGPSGAGKTSLLRLLNRLVDPTSGAIAFHGRDLRSLPVLPLRRRITLIPQESRLLGMTVRDALVYPLTLRGVDKATIRQRIDTWADQLHLPREWFDRTEVQLSVGQRQLVAIARALVIQPEVLLLDEPTSALDTGRASHLMQVLTRLPEMTQTTVLMVNHQLSMAKEFCDRVLYFQDGRLLDDQRAEKLDWGELRDRLVQAEMDYTEEWGEV